MKDHWQLTKYVEVDETFVGGFPPGVIGWATGNRKIVQVAIELDSKDDEDGKLKIKNALARAISDTSAKSLKEGFDQMVHSDAVITTDRYRSYMKAMHGRVHHRVYSDKGNNFEQLHYFIFNLKNWIKGIHHKVSPYHIQNYLDESTYRFNRRNQIAFCPLRIIKRMTNHQWLPLNLAMGK